MCKNKIELYRAAKEYKRLMKQKAEIEAKLSELRDDIIPYVLEHGDPVPKSKYGSAMIYTRGQKVSYIECFRTDLDKAKLQAFLGPSYDMYTKTTEYGQLRVS